MLKQANNPRNDDGGVLWLDLEKEPVDFEQYWHAIGGEQLPIETEALVGGKLVGNDLMLIAYGPMKHPEAEMF